MVIKAQTRSSQDRPVPASRWENIRVTALFLFGFAVIFVYRLDQYPAPWHDEAHYLHVAENYAENGVYADFSSEGNRYTGPIVSLGPTVILPIAMLYKIFGVSILAARVIIAIYALLMLFFLYRFSALWGDQRFARLTLVVAVFNYGLNLPYYARNVMGEVPALCFTFAALWLWLRSERCHPVSLVAVGVLFGLAGITKSQSATFICPSLLLAWVVDMVWYRRRRLLYFIIPGIVTGVLFFSWTVYILYLHDAHLRDVSADLEILRNAQSDSFFLLDFSRISKNILYLIGIAGCGGLFAVVVLYGLYLGRKRDETGQRWGFLSLFLLVSVVIFLTSAGWKRFAVPSLALSAPLLARLVLDLTNDPLSEGRLLLNKLRHPPNARLAVRIGTIMLLVALLPSLVREVYHVFKAPDDSPYRVADYVNTHIPEDALIETWEEELAVLTDHNIHYPPQVVEAYSNFYDRPTSRYYDFRDYVDPDYVVVGQFSKWTGIYSAEHLVDYTLIYSIKEYDIYQRAN